MSENIDELRNMLITFRVSELQMLLGFAGRNKSGRKTELQQRALELLRVRSHPIHQKIRDLYKTIQQSATLSAIAASDPSGNKDLNMPQTGQVPRTTATVHPYNVDTRLTPRPLFGQSIYSPYAQYGQKTTQQQQQSQNMLPNNYPIHPDVKFRRLPFYDILADLLRPSSLVPQNNQRMQEGTFYFHLTPQQATDVASSRDIRPGVKCDYVKQVQLRFCLLETTCEQDDYFPPNVAVKVNNKPCALPNPIPTNKPGVEPKRPPRPVNITQMVKLSPTVANAIHVTWAADYGRCFAITVALVHKLTSSDLLQRLKNKGVKHADYTRGLIKEKLRDDGDCEIATTCLRVSLVCPLGKMRMSNPCRSITCHHLQCFDASLYLQMNERKPTWNCPVCDKPALYDNLVIDGYFQDVLASNNLPSDLNEIQLHKDGSWTTQIVEKKEPKVEKITTADDSIEIIGDDSGDDVEYVTSNNTASSSTDKSSAPIAVDDGKDKTVVDLTLSDSDDDEPLAKRRAVNPKPDSTIKFSDSTSISSSSNQSRVTTTPGPSSVSSSGYPASPNIITLDSSSPPRSPNNASAAAAGGITAANSNNSNNTNYTQLPSCMLAGSTSAAPSTNGTGTNGAKNSLYTPTTAASHNMPFLDLENEAASNNINNYPTF